MNRNETRPPFLLACLLLFLPGCALRVGSKTVARDRFDYSSALTNSWKQQMLMNMVKMRYVDPPMLLDVAQVVASYTFEGSAAINLPDWEGVPVGPFKRGQQCGRKATQTL